MSPISSILPPLPPQPPTSLVRSSTTQVGGMGAASPATDVTGGFGKLLLGKFDEVNSMQSNADSMVHQMLTGGNVNQAEVLTAVQKADLAFRMMLQVRNKLIEAYRELQQIQI